MFGKIWRLFKKILGLVIIVLVLYIIALMFDMVPDAYTPHKLFPQQYKSFMDMLTKNAAANNATSNISKHIKGYLDSMQQEADGVKNPPPAPVAATTATSHGTAPVAATPTTTTGTAPNTTAALGTPATTDATTQNTEMSPIDRAKQSVQQINQQQQNEQQELNKY